MTTFAVLSEFGPSSRSIMINGLEALHRASRMDADTVYPQFFRLGQDQDRRALSDLLARDPSLTVCDAIEAQLTELVKSMDPSVKWDAATAGAAVSQHVGIMPLDEYGVWVYYLWSHRLVHMLDEKEFALVRTDRNRNKITRDEQAALATKRVGVVGLSVGQSVALCMTLERSFGEIRLADFDCLDLSNLNRIRSGVHSLGSNKTVAVAREIAEIDPFLKVTCFTQGITTANIDAFFGEGGRLDVLIEECDSVEMKILTRQKARELHVPVVMDTSDRGMVDIERFDLDPDRSIMHGMIDHLDIHLAAKAKTSEEKLPFLAPMVGLDTLSPRMKASLLELNQTVGTWPQLATNVMLGGALAADVVRRIFLNDPVASGRWYVDLDQLVGVAPNTPNRDRLATTKLVTIPDLTIDHMLATAAEHRGSRSAGELTRDQARHIAEAGALAPSAGNMQPWKFMLHEGRIFLFHDRARSFSRLDPDSLIPSVALGACIENMILRAEQLGVALAMVLNDVDGDPLVAVLEATDGPLVAKASNESLAEQIHRRCTNRKPGNRVALGRDRLDRLQAAAAGSSARIHFISHRPKIDKVARICGAAERIRIMNIHGHNEFFQHEIRWEKEQVLRTRDGLDVETLELDLNDRIGLRTASDAEAIAHVRSIGGGRAFEKLAGDAIRSSGTLALISIGTHDRAQRIEGGRIAQRLWLEASAQGIAVHPISAPIFLGHASAIADDEVFDPDERQKLAGLDRQLRTEFELSGREPLFLLRLSYADDASVRSLRRPIEELFFTSLPIPS